MATVDWNTFNCLSGPDKDVATISCLEPVFRNVVVSLSALAGIALFVMLIIGGYSYMFAGGDMKKLEKAKGTLSGAAIGLVLIIAAYLIIALISEFVSLPDLKTFKIYIQP